MMIIIISSGFRTDRMKKKLEFIGITLQHNVHNNPITRNTKNISRIKKEREKKR